MSKFKEVPFKVNTLNHDYFEMKQTRAKSVVDGEGRKTYKIHNV